MSVPAVNFLFGTQLTPLFPRQSVSPNTPRVLIYLLSYSRMVNHVQIPGPYFHKYVPPPPPSLLLARVSAAKRARTVAPGPFFEGRECYRWR